MIENCGPGWVKSNLVIDDMEYTLFGSRLSDCISDLVNSTISLLKGRSEVTSKWQDEPGEYRLILSAHEDQLNLKVSHFEDTFSRKINEEGNLEFEATISLVDFARNIIRGVDKLKNSISDIEYSMLWHHDFPYKELEELRALFGEKKEKK